MTGHLSTTTSFGDEKTRPAKPRHHAGYDSIRLRNLADEFCEAIREGRADHHLDRLLLAIRDRNGDLLDESA